MYTRLLTKTSTRVLKLFPGEPDSQIVTSLEQVDLENGPVYQCLSYTWGASDNTSDISVCNTSFAVRKNLYDFLRRFRDATETRSLWVDALCISQTDLDEKAHQVIMIGRIFQQAARVLLWVGESADNSNMLFQPTADAPLWRKALGAQTGSKAIRQRVTAWNAFLSRPYWTRTWIVQEIICAKSIVVRCGADHADWKTLIRPRVHEVFEYLFNGISLSSMKVHKVVGLDAGCLFGNTTTNIARLVYARRGHWQDRDTAAPEHQIMGMISQFASNESFDRRDKIYSMLSLEPEEAFRNAIGVDYEISVEELCVRVLSALERYGWNGRIVASEMVQIFSMSRREVRELLNHLTFNHWATSTESISYLERYTIDGFLVAPMIEP